MINCKILIILIENLQTLIVNFLIVLIMLKDLQKLINFINN
jgi:hypothetical protein